MRLRLFLAIKTAHNLATNSSPRRRPIVGPALQGCCLNGFRYDFRRFFSEQVGVLTFAVVAAAAVGGLAAATYLDGKYQLGRDIRNLRKEKRREREYARRGMAFGKEVKTHTC